VEGLVHLLLELILPLGLLGALVVLVGLFLVAGVAQVLAAPWISGARARRLRRLSLGAAAGLAFGLILAQALFFQPIVRSLAAAVRTKTGIEVRFANASGNLFAGRVVLHEAAVRRTGDPSASFDLTVRELALDLRLLRLLRGEVAVESVRVAGARGSYIRAAGPERPPRKPFLVDVLLVEDAEIAWTLQRRGRPDVSAAVRIDRLETRPFQGRDAAGSVLFQSQARGTVGGAPFTIAPGPPAVWTADGVPAGLMADLLGEPFDWLREGSADVRITAVGVGTAELDLHCRVLLKDVRPAVPERITGLKRKVAESVVGFLRRKPREVPLELTLRVPADGFRGRLSVESLELWDAVADALAVKLAEASGLSSDTLREGLEKLKGLFRQRATD
jgi:hypothetical protein